MQWMILYASALVIFAVLDAVMITRVILPLFQRHVGDLLADQPRILAAAIFYFGYIAGIVHFAAWPALSAGKPLQALTQGALLGLMCYATYELTNMATLRGWSWQQVIVDSVWGAVLTGLAAWGAVLVAQMFSAPSAS